MQHNAISKYRSNLKLFRSKCKVNLNMVRPNRTQNFKPQQVRDSEKIFLWAVPKKRRSRERRLTRKFGSETGHKKLLPRLRLLTCDNCGNVYEPGHLCPTCYAKVKEVTEEMQCAMRSSYGLNPVEEEVHFVFEGEKRENNREFYNGKRIVEVPKKRPEWFPEKLRQKSAVTTSSKTSVAKPVDLA